MIKGRPRQFDLEEALDKAILVFWEKGYRGTSLDDLTDAMSINRPSLYAAFKDKETLFLSAIDRYRSHFLVPPTKKLLTARSLYEGLPEYFKAMSNVTLNDKTPPGCMISCLLSEDCCDSAVIKKKLADSIAFADATFRDIFKQHKSELNEYISPENAAKLLTTMLQGMAIRARSGASKRDLLHISSTFIRTLLTA